MWIKWSTVSTFLMHWLSPLEHVEIMLIWEIVELFQVVLTNDCMSGDSSVRFLKFVDDTAVISLIRDRDESAGRQKVEQLLLRSRWNHLELNLLKTLTMTVNSRRSPPTLLLSQASTAWSHLWTLSGFWDLILDSMGSTPQTTHNHSVEVGL